jgi:hypothetical protein
MQIQYVPVVHFSGNFIFHMPVYNNIPRNKKKFFDSNLKKVDVLQLCGCDPAHYFEFQFDNVKATQITFNNGEVDTKNDLIIGQSVGLKGLMPDISPSAICAQLFAGNLEIKDFLTAKARKALQSDLRLSIRPLGFGDETAAAHFETKLDILTINRTDSRCIKELNDIKTLELYYLLNHYTDVDNTEEPIEKRLTGDVYGYIRSSEDEANDNSSQRTRSRRLVAHPNLKSTTEVGRLFLYSNPTNPDEPIMRITDIEGFYDIFKINNLLMLRYLDFIPFLDRKYTTPPMDTYHVYFLRKNGEQIDIGQFKGDHEEMKYTGGLLVFKMPEQILHDDILVIDVIKRDRSAVPLMIESEWDILLESERGLSLGSGDEREVVARVYHKNKPAQGHSVRLSTENQNPRSPIVASFKDGTLNTDGEGKVKATIKAIDLSEANGVYDPVDRLVYNQLPMDRNYGNYVYIEIDNALRRTVPPVEQIEIPVRVLQHVKPESTPLSEMSFRTHILPLFSYYTRYFPWLHAIETDNHYTRFFDLENPSDFRQLVTIVIDRLSRDEHDWQKMPRSRDFPLGGIEMIKRWQDAGTPD